MQCIDPPKIWMKCYLLMNTASKRNSTISLIAYENWCPQDDNWCRTCARITQLCKGSLGKIENTSKNYWKSRPSLSKFFWSQEDLDMLSAKCLRDNLPIHKVYSEVLVKNFYAQISCRRHLKLMKIILILIHCAVCVVFVYINFPAWTKLNWLVTCPTKSRQK